MKYLGTLKTYKLNGKYKLKVEVWHTGRTGTESPQTLYYRYRNRWISPYERNLRWKRMSGIDWMGFHVGIIYKASILKDLLYKENPLLARISKGPDWGGKYIEIPIKYGK